MKQCDFICNQNASRIPGGSCVRLLCWNNAAQIKCLINLLCRNVASPAVRIYYIIKT
jgi:hypothetical protein